MYSNKMDIIKRLNNVAMYHVVYVCLYFSLTFTLLSFFGVLALLPKLEAGKGLRLFLYRIT